MEGPVLLDTNICIEILKKNPAILKKVVDGKEYFVSSVTEFELLLRAMNRETIHTLLRTLVVLPFDSACAENAASIYRELKDKGRLVEFRDIFIAATCIVHQCNLLTLNKKHFASINDLKLV